MATPGGFFVTKKTAIILGCAFVASLLIVGIAVGVSSKKSTGDEQPDPTPTGSSPDPTPAPCTQPWCELRIPQKIYLPVKYDLTLEPDLESEEGNNYTGKVIATVEVLQPTSVFMIHIKNLTVTETSLSGDHQVDDAFHFEPNQFWVIRTKAPVPKGSLDITLEFRGRLTLGIVGFYKSTYKDASKKVHALATSKFEPSDARKAFPCFDEPNLKANFTVSLIYKETVNGNSGYYGLSNMPTDGAPEDLSGGRFKQKFQESVKMSTYLVCFIVCDFDKKIEKTAKSKIDFGVYWPKGMGNQADYALKVGKVIIDYYEEFFSVKYPLPKQDMIAIPDFPSGAMEHWGLITYRMTSMLYDESMASLSEKQRVTTVVAHELAHMWFGNLVTMDWWDDLWLNEGFASFVQYLGVDKAEPDFKILDQFLSMSMKGVMELDSSKGSHPIITKVTSPNQITELFDAITYSKGCSVIRMLEAYLGETDFRKGVQGYLNAHKWGNAKNADLWKALSNAAADVDVSALMSSWTTKSHYPVVIVEEVNAGDNTTIKLKQETFLLDDASAQDTLWEIPLMAVGSNKNGKSKVTKTLFKKQSDRITLPDIDPSAGKKYLKLNAGQYGFYRVLYDSARWASLTALLKDHVTELDPVDRAGILDDAFNLARAGKMKYEDALKAIEYLDKELDYVPWTVVSSALNYITDNYEGEEVGKWRKYVSIKAGNVLDAIQFEVQPGESFSRKRLRPTLISLACRHGNRNCLTNTEAKFAEWLNSADVDVNSNNSKPVDVNIRQQVYRYGMIKAGDTQWTKVHEIYKSTSTPQERKKLRYGMAMTRVPWILRRFIDMAATEEEGFKSQDYFGIMESIASNPVGLPIVWDYIKSEWPQLVKRFGISDRYFGRMINRIISNFNTDYQLKDVEAFFAKYPEAGAGARARKEGLTNINNNIAWKSKYESSLTRWLRNQKDITL